MSRRVARKKKIIGTKKLLEALYDMGCQNKTAGLTAGSYKGLSWQTAHDSRLAIIFSLSMEIKPSCSVELAVTKGAQ